MSVSKITEESGVHKTWHEEANGVTVETLGAFVAKLSNDYEHDYGTICHAIAAAMHAAFRAILSSPQGDITGFQASCIMWTVLEKSFHITGPARLLEMDDLLFPRCRGKFTTISQETWEYIQKTAGLRLVEHNNGAVVSPDVLQHWRSIVAGTVPFGLQLDRSEEQQ